MARNQRTTWQTLVQGGSPNIGHVDDENPFAKGKRVDRGKDPVIRLDPVVMDDVLFIHPNDHASLQLVAVQLTGNNYYTWSRCVKRALCGRNKLEIIDGTVSEPAIDSPYHSAWLKADSLVYTWVVNSISKELAVGFQYLDSAAHLWKEIEARFDTSSGPKLYQLERELMNCVQGNLSVMHYFKMLNSLWDEISLIYSQTNCACVCGAGQRLELDDRKRAIKFLLGLNDSYAAVRSKILLVDPLLSVSRIYSMVLQDEDQKRVASHNVQRSEAIMHAVASHKSGMTDTKPWMSKEEKRRLKCSHCGGRGHEAKACFKLHGFPDCYKELKKRRDANHVTV